MSFLDDYREVLFAGLSGHTRKNYDNVITEVEAACDKKIFLVDASDVEQLKENLDKYHYWTSNSEKTWVRSTEQLKISCIIAVGRRLESLFSTNSEYNTEFFQKTAGKMRNMVLIPVRRLNRLRRREKRILAF